MGLLLEVTQKTLINVCQLVRDTVSSTGLIIGLQDT